jgi:predicted RNase H-like HicB family nuclease
MDTEYLVIIQLTDTGDYLGYMPEIPGCAARGDSVEETEANLRTALDNHLALLRAHEAAELAEV